MINKIMFTCCFAILGLQMSIAQLRLPAIFGDHMVLQQKQINPVWGWATPGETITVEINGQSQTTKSDLKGNWKVKLMPLPVGGPYRLNIAGEKSC